ncbi:MAG: HPr kinase/phosphatase C-terminal domain-containing protein [Alphaproteobacteria bacterium]|jgi:serine kinase of HPr protein (carbohydrate metabolism regulator)|nr:HPr kinase/phosphatase C-terminal domain-containing protein [Alphaproteobacteria bacterium]
MTCIHASCVAVGDAGVLIEGAPGSGKSDLALRLIDAGAVLVADDQVQLARRGEALLASAPAPLQGLIEIRGIGIVRLAHDADVPIRLAVTLCDGAVERLPEPTARTLQGIAVPAISLVAFEASAAPRVRLALRTVLAGGSFAGALGEAVS